jgi:hypothetical protein
MVIDVWNAGKAVWLPARHTGVATGERNVLQETGSRIVALRKNNNIYKKWRRIGRQRK